MVALIGLLTVGVAVAFGGARNAAEDRAAQADADAVVDAVTNYYEATGSLPNDVSRLLPGTPEVVGGTEVPPPGSVSVTGSRGGDGNVPFIAVAAPATDACWYMVVALGPLESSTVRRYGVSVDLDRFACTAQVGLEALSAAPADEVGATSWVGPTKLGLD